MDLKEKVVERDVVVAILIKSNSLLLQKKTIDYPLFPGGYWALFGGEVESGEKPEETLKRELKEEINFELNKFVLFDVKDYEVKNKQGKKYIFVVEFDKELKDISLGEGAGFAFFEFSELDSLRIIPVSYQSIKDYLGSIKTN